MNYCRFCGAPIAPDAFVCPHCGRQVGEIEGTALGTLAVIFGALGGILGLVFGIIGLCTYKTERSRKRCKIGIGLFVGWIIFWIVIIMIGIGATTI